MRDVLNKEVVALLTMVRKYKKGIEIIKETPDQITFNILNKEKGEEILLRVSIFYNKEDGLYYLKEDDKNAWTQLMDSFEPEYHMREAVRDIKHFSWSLD